VPRNTYAATERIYGLGTNFGVEKLFSGPFRQLHILVIWRGIEGTSQKESEEAYTMEKIARELTVLSYRV
jgi:hypothetical protein